MAVLFLSHASADRAEALELKRALVAAGYADVFLSSDPEAGIAPGAQWEQALYASLNRAHAVVALWSPRAEASKWCFAEVAHARALHKPVLPVLWETRALPSTLAGVQATKWTEDRDAAVASLVRGLREHGIAPGTAWWSRSWTRPLVRGLAAAAALALLAGALLRRGEDERPAYVSVVAHPPATFRLDGQEVGTTPVAGYRVTAGAHELSLERPRFHPFVRRFQVDGGSTFEIERGLRALDSADREAMRAVASAFGLELSEVEAVRAGGDPPALLAAFPRGVLRAAPTELVLWGDGSAPSHTLKLEQLTDGAPEPLWEAQVPRTVGRIVVPLPAEVSARLPAGSRFRLRVFAPRGGELSAALGSVLTVAEAGTLERDLERLGAGFDAEDALPELLRVDLLLQRGLFTEAHERTQRLQAALGPRREVARLALATLDRAGLAEQLDWNDWVERFEGGR